MCHDGKFTTNVAERECGVPNLLEADLQQNLETLYSQGHCPDFTLVYQVIINNLFIINKQN